MAKVFEKICIVSGIIAVASAFGSWVLPAFEGVPDVVYMVLIFLALISIFIALIMSTAAYIRGTEHQRFVSLGFLFGIIGFILLLAYFGPINNPFVPPRMPERCFVGPGFGCADYSGNASDDMVRVTIINNLGADINSVKFTIISSKPEGINSVQGCDNCDWRANEMKDIVFSGADLEESRALVVFEIEYRMNTGITNTVEGEVLARVW